VRHVRALTLCSPRTQDVEYSVSHRSGHFFITLRDRERPNSELRIAPVEDPKQQLVSASVVPVCRCIASSMLWCVVCVCAEEHCDVHVSVHSA